MHGTSGLEQLSGSILLVNTEKDKSPPVTVWLLAPICTQCTPGWVHLQVMQCFTKIQNQNKIQSTKPSIFTGSSSLEHMVLGTAGGPRNAVPVHWETPFDSSIIPMAPQGEQFHSAESLGRYQQAPVFFPCDLKPRQMKHIRENSCFQDWGTGKGNTETQIDLLNSTASPALTVVTNHKKQLQEQI